MNVTPRFVKAVAVVLLAGTGGFAHAGPGNGIRLGGAEGRIHPFLDVESRYDSNVSYSAADEELADVVLHFRPGIELTVPGDVASVELSGALDWAEYLGIDDPKTKDLSKLYGDAKLAAQFARRSAVSVRIDDDFRRQVSASSATVLGNAVVSNSNVLTMSLPWTPGGGALVLTGSGQWILETFEEYEDLPGAPDVSELGYSQFRGGAEVQWRFLPRTSAVLSGAYFTRVPSASAATDTSGFDALAGITGLLTARVAATAKVGYASTSTPARDTSTVVANVSLEWLPLESLSLRTGYTRSLGVDPIASVYSADAVNAGFRLRLAERFAFRTDARYTRLQFSALPGAETTFLRVDPVIEGAFGKWLTVGAGYVLNTRTASSPIANSPDYKKNEAFVRLALTY